MDFFAQQDEARRASRWLVLWYLVAAAFVVLCFNLAGALGYAVIAIFGLLPLAGDEVVVWQGLARTYWHALVNIPPAFHLWVTAIVGFVVAGVSAWRIWKLSEGGIAVAQMLSARYLERGRASATETRLLNVVEEMAIASGIAVPPVYLLGYDDAVNALVAGHTPNEAVIIVTRGLVQKLTRDELQGVMGHEFSHILNGDMALNIRLAGLLGGLTVFGEVGEALVYGAADTARGKSRENVGGEVFSAMIGTLIAFIAFPGSFAAEAIKAAISRRRELLADAASVQFTRNPDGIAGALDAVSLLRAGTTLRGLYVDELSHMFFLPAVAHWWGFPTHPPIEERIRRVHPRFQRDDYRRTRPGHHGGDRRVAVLDGGGSVVKVLGGIGAAAALVEAPRHEHVDHARRLLERLPPTVKRRLQTPEGAAQVMCALLLEREGPVRERQLQLLGAEAEQVAAARFELQGVGRRQFLLLLELALPALKQWAQKRRDAFLAMVQALVEADQKTTLGEFVQATLLRQRLREGAGKPILTRYKKVEDVAADANAVISLIAHVSRGSTEVSHAKGQAILGFALPALLTLGELTAARMQQALERLRHLAPFQKPRLLKACVETAAADGPFRLAEMELVRAVAATLDCPIPPVIQSLDPATLAA
ncbi:MAG TPA: M48 family metalloprotease [Burkholderiales bacterium]|nr:M48 family metalloprotease [Burkholderiales bacterium]